MRSRNSTQERRSLISILQITLVAGLLFLSSVSGSDGKPILLITSDEASAPDLAPKHFEADRHVSPGPVVEVITPQSGGTYEPPVPIKVRFIPRDGKEIDLSSFKVEYLKLFTIDITYRLLPHTSKEGVNVPAADIPAGKHMIRLSVADVTGATTSILIVVSVK